MSIPHLNLTCDRCNYQGSSLSLKGRCEYILDSGIRLPLSTDIGWCDECESVVSIENLDWKRVRRWLAGLQSEYSELWFWQIKEKRDRQAEIADVTDLLDLVTSRNHQPRCLSCGSKNVSQLNSLSGFKHPHCGGTIISKESDMRMGFSPTVTLFSPDGIMIETERLGGYSDPGLVYDEQRRSKNAKFRKGSSL